MKTMNLFFIGVVTTGAFFSFLFKEKNQKIDPPVEIAVQEFKSPSWKCPDCTPEEKYILQELQEKTKIVDRNALATILGNIKQESKFIANICEGGARVPYDRCHRGGYGIIQWTSENRYLGLGNFAKKYGCDPSNFKCQTRYMINESVFQKYLPMFEGSGESISQYMVPAYYWLGWGIKGKREIYSHNYYQKLVLQ
jgi:hypothetical protein